MLSALHLPFFRNHAGLRLRDLPRHVMLHGANGAGKTNLLEAISLFGQNRGFRNAQLEEFCPLENPQQGFAVHLWLAPSEQAQTRDGGRAHLATLFSPSARSGDKGGDDKGGDDKGENYKGENYRVWRRRFLYNDEEIPQHALQRHLRLCWLLPQMGTFFTDGIKTRRAWVDRIAAKNDPEHEQRLARHRVLVKERLAVLSSYASEAAWLEQLEQKIAACAVALTASRADTLARLNVLLIEHALFAELPKLRTSLVSKIADDLAQHDALSAESRLLDRLRAARAQDRTEQRSREGAHRLRVVIENLSLFSKPVAAHLCSCGEQKSMLIAMLVAEALLLMGTAQRKPDPVLLLDDFPAHIDTSTQEKVLRVLAQLQTQCFYTATEPVPSAQEALYAKGFLLESLTARKKNLTAMPALRALRSNAA